MVCSSTRNDSQVIGRLQLKIDLARLHFGRIRVVRSHDGVGTVIRLFRNADQTMAAAKHLPLQKVNAHIGNDACAWAAFAMTGPVFPTHTRGPSVPFFCKMTEYQFRRITRQRLNIGSAHRSSTTCLKSARPGSYSARRGNSRLLFLFARNLLSQLHLAIFRGTSGVSCRQGTFWRR